MQTTSTSRPPKNALRRIAPLLAVVFVLTLLINGCTIKQPIPRPSYPKRQPVPSHPAPTTPRYPSQPQPLPKPAVPQEPVGTYSPKIGPAGALYAEAQKALGRGNYQQAEMTLERALRIEPRNGHYWYSMAQVKYKQQQFAQAIQLCSKSKSLAGRNTNLLRLNEKLIYQAQQHLSD